MHSQVVCRTVCTSNTLGPAVRVEKLAVPAVRCVVSHLVLKVLSESELGHVHTNLLHELVDPDQEVAECLVVDELGRDSLANGDHLRLGASRRLILTTEQRKLDICHRRELGVLLATLWVDKVLDFTHQELSYTQKTGTGGELVTERVANGCGGKGKLTIAVFQQLLERQKLSLGSLWSEESWCVAGGTDLCLEHEVHGDWRLDLVASGRVADVVLLNELTHSISGKVVENGKNVLVLVADLVVELNSSLGSLGCLLLLLGVIFLFFCLLAACLPVASEASLKNILDQMISSQNLTSLWVLACSVSVVHDLDGQFVRLHHSHMKSAKRSLYSISIGSHVRR